MPSENKLYFNEMISMSSVCNINVFIMDLYSVSSLNQRFTGIHVAQLGHIFLMPRLAVYDLTYK
jgi:hypothetical protein